MTGDTNKDTDNENEANSSDEDVDKVTATMDVVLTVSAKQYPQGTSICSQAMNSKKKWS